MMRVKYSIVLFLLIATVSRAQVVINEVCYDSGMLPGAYAASDWIELYNRGDRAVNVGGYALADTHPYDEAKGVRLPDYVLPPGGFLLVYADGNGAEYTAWVDTPAGRIPVVHGQFRVGRGGERIHLFDPTLTRIQRFESPGYEIGRNVSYGAYPDGSTTSFRIFTTPTPGASNTGVSGGATGGGTTHGVAGVYSGHFRTVGGVEVADADVSVRGTLSLKVADAAGKLTAKVVLQKGSVSFRCSEWDSAEDDGTKHVSLTGRNGEMLQVWVRPDRVWGTLSGGMLGEETFVLEGVRNRFADGSDTEAQRALERFKGYYTVALPVASALSGLSESSTAPQGVGYLTVTVGAKGLTKVAGVLADGTRVSMSSLLLLQGAAGDVHAQVPLAAALYTRRGWLGGLLEMSPEGGAVVTGPELGESICWERSGQGGDGFCERLDACGGWYAPVPSLAQHYLFSADVASAPYHDADGAIEWTVAPALVPISVTGARMTVAKGARPVKDEDGRYLYGGENPASATFSFVARTGVFRGRFLLYCDYVTGTRAMHKRVSVPYAGVLVAVRGSVFDDLPAGMGHCLVPDNDPAVRPSRVKRSCPVWLDAD